MKLPFRGHKKTLSPKTPQWFKDWHNIYFKTVDTRSSRNEKLIYIILASVLALNTVGNYFHDNVAGFFARLFGG